MGGGHRDSAISFTFLFLTDNDINCNMVCVVKERKKGSNGKDKCGAWEWR